MDEEKQPFNRYTQPVDFEKLTSIVSAEFQLEECLIEKMVPTYYLKQPQETKQSFLKLLKNLETMNLIALLRRKNGRIVLKIVPKPPTKPSNIMVNWILFFATIGTTFLTGYMLSGDLTNPLVGGATFTIAIMAVLGTHEMGHKVTANKRGIEATPPYFIPGPPPIGGFLLIGTFGAVIMQKSLPPNKDALFDVGGSGPIVGFIVAVIVTIVGLPFSGYDWIPKDVSTLPVPLLFQLVAPFLLPPVGMRPPCPGPDYVSVIILHPVALAGWVGMIVTMLNLLPAAMLDGGHIARSLLGEKTRVVLTFLSIVSLIFVSPPMAIFVLFLSMYKHPGPLDDVSSLSTRRKLLAIVAVAVFVLCSFLHYLVFILLELLGGLIW
jgi:membrane-associated protease RseP (regulator of RpoE activity)